MTSALGSKKPPQIDRSDLITEVPRIILAGTGSGCGKTTVTSAILAALSRRGTAVRPFKAGPDYIDPKFHSHITGRPSYNLDPWMYDPQTLRYLLRKNALRDGGGTAIIEGVMGFYDGLLSEPLRGSTAELAIVTGSPVVLVVNARGLALSIAAVINGFASLSEDVRIAGVILNQMREATYQKLKPQIEAFTGIPLLGFLPPAEDCTFESRHLGLVTPEEMAKLDRQVEKLADLAAGHIDLDRLLSLANEAGPLDGECPEPVKAALSWARDGAPAGVRLGLALDKAFNFYYQDNLDLLEEMGVGLVPFSPLEDADLPADLQGLYIGGGYPENHAQILSENQSMKSAIRDFFEDGGLILAECGGFMYLGSQMTDLEGRSWPMTGVLPSAFHMTGRLRRFGYVRLTAQVDGLFAGPGAVIRAHEFHYSDSDDNGTAFKAEKPGGQCWDSSHMDDRLCAGYPHLPFYANPACAARFARALASRLHGDKIKK